MTFGEKFKAEREKKNLTQQQVADGLGINRRMITRYENNLSFPRTRDNYKKIADFFGVDINYFLSEDDAFVVQASEQYGTRGMKQAQDLIDGMSGLFAGGILSEQDKDAVMKALQDIYWESKARNVEKYTPKKYKRLTVRFIVLFLFYNQNGNLQLEGGERSVIIRSEEIYKKANSIVRSCGTRDTLKIARELGIYVHYIDTLNDLLGMYTYRHKERHILLNSGMEHMVMQMVCGHEIGHDVFHRDLAKKGNALPEFTLFDMRSKPEYEANAFAAHLIIDNDELVEYMQEGYDVVQLSAMMGTNINLMLIKLNEMNRMGWGLNLPYVPHADFLKQIKPEG